MNLFRSLLALSFTLASPLLVAQEYVEGTHYQRIETPIQPSPGEGVEVAEVFSYACPACASFQPLVDAFRKAQPAGARFVYVPAAFNPTWELFARSFYAAEALGIQPAMHQEIYDAVHVKRSVKTLEDVARLATKHGKTEAEFIAVARSFGVQAKINRSNQVLPRAGISGTPTLIVAGKYRVEFEGAGRDNMFKVASFLVAKELAEAAGTAPAAPPAATPAN